MRANFEAEHGAIWKYLMARSLDAPPDEKERLRDLALLHARVAIMPERAGRVLLQLKPHCGRPALAHFLESIQ